MSAFARPSSNEPASDFTYPDRLFENLLGDTLDFAQYQPHNARSGTHFGPSSLLGDLFRPFLPAATADDYRDSITDTTAPFGVLTPGGSVTGGIEDRGDRDVFKITLTAGQTYTFDLTKAASGGLSDPYLRLLGADGRQLATNDDFGGSLNSRITFTATNSGTYYLEARGYDSSAVGKYTLTSSGTTAVPADDFRDSLTDTTAPLGSLSVDATRSGAIETAGDKDMFAVSLVEGQSYTFNLTRGTTGGLADPLLRLLDSNGAQIAINDNAGGTQNSELKFTATKSGTFYLEAQGADAAATGTYTLGAKNTTPANSGDFDIKIVFSGDARYQAAFEEAAARWEAVITGDIPDFVSSRFGAIDDLLISASAVAIDGVGRILGRAGPDELRRGSDLPTHGTMEFDSADLAGMANNGTLTDIILHEMGHVLGLGTLWERHGLVSNTYNYIGQHALEEYRTLTGNPNATFVPLERTGGPGTAGGHWADNLFGSELMTGFASGGMEMSRLTIASLEDLGYEVDYSAAEPYSLPSTMRLTTGSEELLIV